MLKASRAFWEKHPFDKITIPHDHRSGRIDPTNLLQSIFRINMTWWSGYFRRTLSVRWIAFCSTVCSRKPSSSCLRVSIRTGNSMPRCCRSVDRTVWRKCWVRAAGRAVPPGDHREGHQGHSPEPGAQRYLCKPVFSVGACDFHRGLAGRRRQRGVGG